MTMQSLQCRSFRRSSVGGPRTVLHIEDDAFDALLLRGLIEAPDWPDPASRPECLLQAGSLKDALALLETEPVDAIILDLGLSDQSGMECCRRLLDEVPHVPVIVLTGRSDPALGLDAVRLGAQDFLTKDEVNPLALWRALTFGQERHRTLADLASALRDKNAAQHRAEQEAKAARAASRAKADFLALMSHEFRTPLNGIIGLSSVLAQRASDPNDRAKADTIRKSGDRVLSLVSDIVDVVALGTQPVEVEPERFNPGHLANRVFTDAAEEAKAKGIELSFDPGLRPTEEVQGDAPRLGRLLSHLVGEALHASPPGALKAALRLEQMPCCCRSGAPDHQAQSRRVLCFDVVHRGAPPDETLRARLMAPVVQGDAPLGGPEEGGSLNLALIRGLCALMGGTFGIMPKDGGTRLWVKVPVDALGQPACAPNPFPGGGPVSGAAGSQKTVCPDGPKKLLVVEDTRVNRLVFEAILGETDYHIQFALDGPSAFDLAKTGAYALVLMDIQLPGMDGVETTRKIRALPGSIGRVPIIAVTAFGVPGDRDRFLAAGMDDYLTKPVTPGPLLKAIDRFLKPGQDHTWVVP